MRWAIRDLQTGHFYAGQHWTSNVEFAEKFLDFEAAIGVASALQVKRIELVIISEDGLVAGGVEPSP
jgi:hypothetical protein